jgi:hypothetical protein
MSQIRTCTLTISEPFVNLFSDLQPNADFKRLSARIPGTFLTA